MSRVLLTLQTSVLQSMNFFLFIVVLFTQRFGVGLVGEASATESRQGPCTQRRRRMPLNELLSYNDNSLFKA